MKSPCLQAPVVAFTHDPLHVLVRDLEISEQRAFELVAALGIFGNVPDPLQRQSDMTAVNRLPERLRSPEVPMRELFNLTHAQFLSAHGDNKVLDLLLFYSVHAHELPQCVHVRINWKPAAEDLPPHFFAHLADQSQPHAHPGFAPRQLCCDLCHGHLVQPPQFVDKSGLFQNPQ